MKSQVEFNPVSPGSSSAAGVVEGEPASNGAPHLKRSAPRPRMGATVSPALHSQQWWQLAVAAGRHWLWLVIALAIGAALGVGIGRRIWSTTYTATAQLVRYDTPDPQLFQPRAINPATLVGMINSAEVRTRVGARLNLPTTAEQFTNSFLQSMHDAKQAGFRTRFRDCAVLLHVRGGDCAAFQ